MKYILNESEFLFRIENFTLNYKILNRLIKAYLKSNKKYTYIIFKDLSTKFS